MKRHEFADAQQETIHWAERGRRVAPRYENLAANYRATVTRADIMLR
jgi:hypothetical protein